MTLDEYLVEYSRRQAVTRRLVTLLEKDLLVAFKKRKVSDEEVAFYERQVSGYKVLGSAQKEVVEMLKDLKRQQTGQQTTTATEKSRKERSCGPSDRR